jgi:hypothetical protein
MDWEDDLESDDEGYNPLGNFSSSMVARHPRHHVNRHHHLNPLSQPFIRFIDRDNGRGIFHREFIIN